MVPRVKVWMLWNFAWIEKARRKINTYSISIISHVNFQDVHRQAKFVRPMARALSHLFLLIRTANALCFPASLINFVLVVTLPSLFITIHMWMYHISHVIHVAKYIKSQMLYFQDMNSRVWPYFNWAHISSQATYRAALPRIAVPRTGDSLVIQIK